MTKKRGGKSTGESAAFGKIGGLIGGKRRAAKLSQEERSEIARKGGSSRMARLTKQQRSELARQAVLARWNKKR